MDNETMAAEIMSRHESVRELTRLAEKTVSKKQKQWNVVIGRTNESCVSNKLRIIANWFHWWSYVKTDK